MKGFAAEVRNDFLNCKLLVGKHCMMTPKEVPTMYCIDGGAEVAYYDYDHDHDYHR